MNWTIKQSAAVLSICLLLSAGCDGYSSTEREGVERVKEQLFDPNSA
jgi:hypothetical protein